MSARPIPLPSAFADRDAAIENLRDREGTIASEIGFVEPASGKQSDVAMERHPQVVATIAAWAEASGYDAAIWTALASNFSEHGKGGEPFSVTAAIRYLEKLEKEHRRRVRPGARLHPESAARGSRRPVRDEVAKHWPQ